MIEPLTPKGFRDFLPEEALTRGVVLSKIKEVFKVFGFDPLETPAIEFASTLKGKYGEDEKLIYEFEDRGGRQIALRYDQTVPLARVVAQYPNLPKPFRRYQIQNVWRAENTQRGRFREFLQIDFDIVGVSSLLADLEIAQIISSVLTYLGFEKHKIMLNSRPLLFKLVKEAGVDEKLVVGAISSVDKLKKIGEEAVIDEMVQKGISKDTAKKVLDSFQHATAPDDVSDLLKMLESSGYTNFVFEPTLARGLEYYTGIIFEGEVEGFTAGSVCGGGRYDDLIGRFSGSDLPATGASFGFDRLLEAMREQNLLPVTKTNTQILVTIFSPELLNKSLETVKTLRDSGIKTEIYLDENAKLEKQLKYADAKGIPYALILGPQESKDNNVVLKDLNSQTQAKISLDQVIQKLIVL